MYGKGLQIFKSVRSLAVIAAQGIFLRGIAGAIAAPFRAVAARSPATTAETMAVLCALAFTMQIAWPATAKAGERFEFYNGVRSLGMGGASVAVVNDETALISNPAALGKLRNYFITVADPELDIGAETQAAVGTDLTAFMDPQDTLDKVNAAPKRRIYERAQIFPSLVVPNFGAGLFIKYEASAFIDETTGNFNYNYNNDMAAVIGFNFRMFDGIVKLGFNVRGVNHATVRRDDIATNTTNLDLDDIAKEGFGIASDAGLLIALPITFLPTIGAVYRDVGHTHYTINNGMNLNTDERPDATPATLDVGMAIFPIIGKNSRMAITAELKDVMMAVEPDEDVMARRMHGGVEFNFGDVFFARAGMNQRYYTAGFELSMYQYQFQLATYGEDVGTKDDPLEDRRYVAKFAWRF